MRKDRNSNNFSIYKNKNKGIGFPSLNSAVHILDLAFSTFIFLFSLPIFSFPFVLNLYIVCKFLSICK